MNAIAKSETFGTRQCKKFRADIFNRHHAIAKDLAAGFLRNAKSDALKNFEREIEGNANGNRWLFAADKKLGISEKAPRSAVLDMQDCEDIGNVAAENTKREIDKAMKRGLDAAVKVAQHRLERYGIAWPVEYKYKIADGELIQVEDEKTRAKECAALARAACPIWWRRQLKKKTRRQVEGILRESGSVLKRRAPYVSDWGLQQWIASQRKNAQLLSAMIATNEEGESFSLAKCAEASVSNPVNRRNELMTRIRGFEEVSDALGLQGVLLTLTAPSKYHAYHAASGQPVENFNQTTPREAMDYLCGVWARIRAEWHRNKIKTIGFRICEPHHDGTPHFHFLLWFSKCEVEQAWASFKEHALAEDGSERGAEKHRCDYVLIDPGKGTAAGYVAKYVSKNIDGFGFTAADQDDEAQIDAQSGSLRARAWASIWGIRQFQQIGAISVTVYRELRRLRDSMMMEPEEIQKAHAAADAGDWAEFVEAMGGVFVDRADQLLRPVYKACEKLGRYGEQIKRLSGLVLGKILVGMKEDFCLRYELVTREKVWEITVNWDLISSWQKAGGG